MMWLKCQIFVPAANFNTLHQSQLFRVQKILSCSSFKKCMNLLGKYNPAVPLPSSVCMGRESTLPDSCFRYRQITLLVPEVSVGTLKMQGNRVVNHGRNTFFHSAIVSANPSFRGLT